jgi:hypothetical protein
LTDTFTQILTNPTSNPEPTSSGHTEIDNFVTKTQESLMNYKKNLKDEKINSKILALANHYLSAAIPFQKLLEMLDRMTTHDIPAS